MKATAASSISQLSQAWHLPRTSHPNMLVVGPDVAMVDALPSLQCVCRQPVDTGWAASPLVLPPASRTGSLILRDVGSLTAEGQRRLMAWLDDARGRTQLIATNADALWPRVEAGSFLKALYYRLNVVYIDLMEQPGRDSQALSLNERPTVPD